MFFLQKMFALRYVEDLRTLGFCLIFFGVCSLQFAYDFNSNMLERFGMFVVTVFFAFLGAVTCHNAIHVPISSSKSVNNAFQIVISLWFGYTASAYVPGHNLSHHRNLQTPRDIMSTYKMKFKSNFLNGVLFAPTIMLATGKNDGAYFAAQRKMGRPIYKQAQIELASWVVFQLALASIDPYKWMFVFFVPQLFGKYMIISLNTLQHDGCDENSKYNHSRNFVDPWLNYFCFNNGYHGIHHMYPGRHWALTKVEHDEKVKPNIHRNLDHPSIFEYMFDRYIYPAQRTTYNGKIYNIPNRGEDEPWFYATTESYSDRASQSYTLMQETGRNSIKRKGETKGNEKYEGKISTDFTY